MDKGQALSHKIVGLVTGEPETKQVLDQAQGVSVEFLPMSLHKYASDPFDLKKMQYFGHPATKKETHFFAAHPSDAANRFHQGLW